MNDVLLAVIIVTAIGAVCGIMLAVFSKIMAVKTDEKLEKIRECLPGVNCGACGYTGCGGYAAALADGTTTKTNLCIPGADAVSQKISEVMGVDFEDVIEQVATIHCSGDCNRTSKKMEYFGKKTCVAANMYYGGTGECSYGCLGFGDCANVCPNKAICIRDGIAHVDTRRCTGCGLCAKVCPKNLITVMPDVKRVLVMCSNKERGIYTRKKCTHGCIGCKKCEKTCPAGAITVKNNLAVIDYEKCQNCYACSEVCTTGCIVVSDFSGIHRLKKA